MAGAWLAVAALAAVSGCDNEAAPAFGDAELRWEDAFDADISAGGTDRSEDDARAIAACGSQIVLIGDSSPLDRGDDDFVIRSLNADDGSLLWSDRVQSGAHDNAHALACDSQRLLATYTSGFDDPVALLHAYDPESGATLWTTQYAEGYGDNPTHLELDGADAFVAVTSWDDPASGAATTSFVRAVNTADGSTRWQNAYPANQPASRGRLTASDTHVFSLIDATLRCFDRATGELLWSASPAPGSNDEYALTATADGSAVVVTGYGYGSQVAAIEAHAAEDGTMLWQHGYDLPTLVSLAAIDGAIVATGAEFIVDEEGEDDVALIEVRDARTGAELWSERRFGEQIAYAAIQDDRVVVGTSRWHSRVYNGRDGTLLSSARAPAAPPTRRLSGVATTGRRYFLGGTFFASTDGPRDYDFGLRAYDY